MYVKCISYIALTVLGHSDLKGENSLRYLTDLYSEKYSHKSVNEASDVKSGGFYNGKIV